MSESKAFEIEIKSLLGGKDAADRLLDGMRRRDPNLKLASSHSQLNHYFEGGDLRQLNEALRDRLHASEWAAFDAMATAKDYSLRTRLADGKLLLVLKVSRDAASSANGTNRVEFEAPVRAAIIDEIDKVILSAGFRYQAKWSRERQEYKFQDITVTLDKNAGYGWLAEFESVVRDEKEIAASKARLVQIMSELGAEELKQDRLERMFKFYNEHWQEYYGTEKVFMVK
ncbi:MAG TPA: CYTH domain-containing protein [Candidatus Paceibacterota bacterium]|nr:CYTH domain-containing protein [Candidatus Paceibacterota bacterium]